MVLSKWTFTPTFSSENIFEIFSEKPKCFTGNTWILIISMYHSSYQVCFLCFYPLLLLVYMFLFCIIDWVPFQTWGVFEVQYCVLMVSSPRIVLSAWSVLN